jgi:hypothetical protein
MEAVLKTESGQQLRDLRDDPQGEEGVDEQAQVGAARERAQERVEDLGRRLGGPPSSPRTVNGTNFYEKALFVKVDLATAVWWTQRLSLCPSRYASIRALFR